MSETERTAEAQRGVQIGTHKGVWRGAEGCERGVERCRGATEWP